MVTLTLRPPERFSRAHLLVRILIWFVASSIAGAIGYPGAIIYLGLPALAAVLVSERGGGGYLEQHAPKVAKALGWLLAFYAYLGLLTDHFPLDGAGDGIHFQVAPSGTPTVKSTLLRLLYTIPAALYLWLLGIAAAVIWVIAFVFVLFSRHYPRSLWDFQAGVLRLHGRVLAYHASLVEPYPDLSLDAGPDERAPVAPQPPVEQHPVAPV